MSDQQKNLIDRREALRRAAWILGGVISTPVAMGFLSGCEAKAGQPLTKFGKNREKLLNQITDIIIPETDTKSASQVGVPAYIEDQVYVIWKEEDREYFLKNLAEFEATAAKEMGKPFIDASEAERTAYINKLHDQVFSGDVDWNAPRPFIWQMKELTVSGYFSTEEGMTKVLQWKLVPGAYKGCIPFEEAGGRVWA